jgi:hypothetical protein
MAQGIQEQIRPLSAIKSKAHFFEVGRKMLWRVAGALLDFEFLGAPFFGVGRRAFYRSTSGAE